MAHTMQINNRYVTFSDKPLRVDGVKITPRFNWSEDYRKWVRGTYRKRPDTTAARHRRARLYHLWREKRDATE